MGGASEQHVVSITITNSMEAGPGSDKKKFTLEPATPPYQIKDPENVCTVEPDAVNVSRVGTGGHFRSLSTTKGTTGIIRYVIPGGQYVADVGFINPFDAADPTKFKMAVWIIEIDDEGRLEGSFFRSGVSDMSKGSPIEKSILASVDGQAYTFKVIAEGDVQGSAGILKIRVTFSNPIEGA